MSLIIIISNSNRVNSNERYLWFEKKIFSKINFKRILCKQLFYHVKFIKF